MESEARIIPTREMLRRLPEKETSASDLSGIEIMLNLFATADKVRHEWYGPLQEKEGISEGKFSLLITLYSEGELSSSHLASHIGVKPATASIMVKRMLEAKNPLLAMRIGDDDHRERFLSLTEEGRKRIEKLLPEHIAILRRFTAKLNEREREELISLLTQLRSG